MKQNLKDALLYDGGMNDSAEDSDDSHFELGDEEKVKKYIAEKKTTLKWGLVKWLVIYVLICAFAFLVMRGANPYTQGGKNITKTPNGGVIAATATVTPTTTVTPTPAASATVTPAASTTPSATPAI